MLRLTLLVVLSFIQSFLALPSSCLGKRDLVYMLRMHMKYVYFVCVNCCLFIFLRFLGVG